MAYAPEPDTGNFGGWRLSQVRSSPADGNGFSFSVITTESGESRIRAPAAMTLSTSSWYHIAGVYSGSHTETYVNGVCLAQTAMPAGHTIRPNPWAGVVVGGHNYWYLGDLDEPAIYPRALTAAEVLEHYQAGTATTPPVSYRDVVLGDNPVGYWPFDEPAPAAPASAATPVSPC